MQFLRIPHFFAFSAISIIFHIFYHYQKIVKYIIGYILQIPNAYYAGNVAGYSGYTSPYFSYQHHYPSQQSQVRTYSTSTSPRNTLKKRVRTYSTFTTSPSNTFTRNTHKVRTYLHRTYPVFQYNTRSIYQQPKQQYNYNTVTENDPYAANPYVTKLRPSSNNFYR